MKHGAHLGASPSSTRAHVKSATHGRYELLDVMWCALYKVTWTLFFIFARKVIHPCAAESWSDTRRCHTSSQERTCKLYSKIFHFRRSRPLIFQVSILLKCPRLAGWHLEVPSVCMRPRLEKKKGEGGYSFLKCQPAEPPRESLWLICYTLSKRRNKSSPLTVCDALAMRWATTQPALCVARRCCGKYHREALRQGTQLDVEKSTEWGRWERHGFTINIFTSDLALCVSPSLPPPLSSSSPSPAAAPRCACKRRFPSFSPGHPQRDFPEFVFDLGTMLGVALSVHTAVGRHGKSNQQHCDLCAAFVTDEQENILKVQ